MSAPEERMDSRKQFGGGSDSNKPQPSSMHDTQYAAGRYWGAPGHQRFGSSSSNESGQSMEGSGMGSNESASRSGSMQDTQYVSGSHWGMPCVGKNEQQQQQQQEHKHE